MEIMKSNSGLSIYEVYLEPEHYNATCRATIQAAWMATTNHGSLAVCRVYEANDEAEAMQRAIESL